MPENRFLPRDAMHKRGLAVVRCLSGDAENAGVENAGVEISGGRLFDRM